MRKLLLAVFLSLLAFLPTLEVAGSTCPPPRSYSGACIQVIVWAKDPVTGTCCVYPTPCSAPTGWNLYFSPEECENAGLPLCADLEGKSCSPEGKTQRCRYEDGTTGIALCEGGVWVIY